MALPLKPKLHSSPARPVRPWFLAGSILLPSSPEPWKLLTCIHAIPLDIVSYAGPQFISEVWKLFCQALGASVSLTSEYHSQSNGQIE